MEAKAVAKTIRVSPQKARLVVDLVRGKQVKEALGMLEYVNKSATPAIIKVVKSAAQNAVYNNRLSSQKLLNLQLKMQYTTMMQMQKNYMLKQSSLMKVQF